MFLQDLKIEISAIWKEAQSNAFFVACETGIDRETYKLVMTQLYHYTKHNAFNQAFAVNRFRDDTNKILKFACKHALEELGHEKMVLSDLESVGLLDDSVKDESKLLPETEALIGYIYFASQYYGVKGRLGYSLWAEDCYDFINTAVRGVQKHLNIDKKNMSFLVSHAHIDAKHSKEVDEIIEEFVTDSHDQANCRKVALTTLKLTLNMLTACAKK